MLAFVPSPAFAWGFAAHRYIMRRAIDLLPARSSRFSSSIATRSCSRGRPRSVAQRRLGGRSRTTFSNFGAPEFGPYPFTALPREYGAALEKFGMATLKRDGLLPWREAEEFGNLRRAFEGFTKGNAYGTTDTVLFAAVAAHYIQDAHQPLHATNNYDGQLTGQNGVHARFERDLIERFESRLTIRPAPPAPMTSARDAAFEALLASYQLVPKVLQADKEAIAGKDTYDDAYFEKFFAKVKPILEQRVAGSITATASMIIGAWEQAGKPPLKTGCRGPSRKSESRRARANSSM